MKNILSNIRDYIKNTDKLLWLFTFLATAYSIILIFSMQQSGDYNYLRTQIIAILIGVVGAVVLSVVDYKNIVKYWYIAAIIGFLLAASVFIFGIQVAGTDDKAWIKLPGGFTFQPSELMKICFIITFSAHLAFLVKKEKLKSLIGVITLFLHAMIPILIIHFQGEDGTALIILLMFLVMAFAAGVQLRYFSILLGGIAVGIPVLWN
ncbi:MAG: FtsW/RodA/SpoVE family cell cycle protein, partial [Acutalibacteraceae bacterium]